MGIRLNIPKPNLNIRFLDPTQALASGQQIALQRQQLEEERRKREEAARLAASQASLAERKFAFEQQKAAAKLELDTRKAGSEILARDTKTQRTIDLQKRQKFMAAMAPAVARGRILLKRGQKGTKVDQALVAQYERAYERGRAAAGDMPEIQAHLPDIMDPESLINTMDQVTAGHYQRTDPDDLVMSQAAENIAGRYGLTASDVKSVHAMGLRDELNTETKRLRRLEDAGKLQRAKAGRTILPSAEAGRQAEKLTMAQSALTRLQDIQGKFKDEYFTLAGRVKAGVVAGKSYLDFEIGSDERQFLEAQDTLFLDIENLFHDYRHIITGAAASEQELKALRRSYLNKDLDPIRARARVEKKIQDMIRDIKFHSRVLKYGLDVSKAEPGPRAQEAPAPTPTQEAPAPAPVGDVTEEQIDAMDMSQLEEFLESFK